MSVYNSPLTKPQLLQKGVPAYMFGNLNMLQGNAMGRVTQTAITTNVASVTVAINEGPIPNVGDLLTIWGTRQQSGLFNVSRAVITAVNISTVDNTGTLSFVLTGTDQAATDDAGAFLCEAGEVGETVSGSVNSAPVTVQAPCDDSQFTLPFAVTGASGITAMTATLQVAIRDIDSEYTNTTTVVTKTGATTYTAGPVVQATLQRGYVYRTAITGVTGSGLVVAKVG